MEPDPVNGQHAPAPGTAVPDTAVPDRRAHVTGCCSAMQRRRVRRSPAEQIRAMTAVRIEQIAVGRSGLGPATALALVDLLNEDRMPTVGRFNSLGTGDVAPLAKRLALTMPPEALDHGDGLPRCRRTP